MLLIVYARTDLRDYITDVEAETIGTGVMGVMVSIIWKLMSCLPLLWLSRATKVE